MTYNIRHDTFMSIINTNSITITIIFEQHLNKCLFQLIEYLTNMYLLIVNL